MCNPMLIAAGMSVAGSLVAKNAQDKAIKKQSAITAQAEESQNNRQREQQGLVLEEALKFDPNKRADSMDQAAAGAEQSLGTAIAQANGAAPQTDAGATGRVSSEYDVARARSVADQTAKAAETARLMSRVRAPGDMMGNEQLDYADMLGQIGTIGSKAKGEWSRDMARVKGVRPNGGQLLLGDALKAGGAMFGTAAASPSGF